MIDKEALQRLLAHRKARPFLATAPTDIKCPGASSEVLEKGLRTHAFASMGERDEFVAAHERDGAYVDSWTRLNGGTLASHTR